MVKRRGRPRKAEGGDTASTWLPSSEYDRLIAAARRRRCSVSALLRRLIRGSLDEHEDTNIPSGKIPENHQAATLSLNGFSEPRDLTEAIFRTSRRLV